MDKNMGQGKWSPPVRQVEAASGPPPSRLETLQASIRGFYIRYRGIFLVAAMVIMALASVLIYNATRPPPQRLTQRDIDAAVERSLATATPRPSIASQAYEIIRPSVVLIEVTIQTTDGKNENGVGTGFVVDDSGTVLTCFHVVKDAAEVRVTFADGTESAASVVVTQPENDLAVLRPELVPDDVLPATLTSSATLRIGDEVVAVGNPFGISGSLSAGVISGMGRSFRDKKTGETLTDLIQFDAAVNPGNSGGPLVNRYGEVVGIVTGLLNPTEQDVFIGIGFAIPIETGAGAAGAPPV